MASYISLNTLPPQNNHNEDAAKALARVLGFDPESDKAYFPWINYIRGHRLSKEKPEKDFLQLCQDVISRFTDINREDHASDPDTSKIQKYLHSLVSDNDHFYFRHIQASSHPREKAVNSTIMLILGLCTLMRSYFVGAGGQPPYIQNFVPRPEEDTDPLPKPLAHLVAVSALLPNPTEALLSGSEAPGATARPETDDTAPVLFGLHSISLEDSISPLDLNLFRLRTLAGVKVRWTDNLSRHMLLSNQGPKKRYVELFALPCALQQGPDEFLRSLVAIPAELQDEIRRSYAILFSPKQASKLHRYADKIIGLQMWCWCIRCSSARLRERELRQLRNSDTVHLVYDPELETLARRAVEKGEDWNRVVFRNLWPRVVALDKCLQEAKPWNFWVLLRDRRDTVQYWTFLFGSIILVLTIAQVVLGSLQVASPFSSK